MKVLVATSMYPSPERPAYGAFVKAQVEALQQAGVEIELFVLNGRSRKLMYPRAVLELRKRLADGSIDLVHAHYSYVGIVARTQWRVPVVVSYCGDDLLGTVNPQGEQTRRLSVLAGRVLGQFVDAAIVKSGEMATKLWRKDVHVIPNEVDFDTFRPVDRDRAREELGLDAKKKYLLFAANPAIPVKRYPLAQEVAARLREADPSIEMLVIHNETQDRLALYMSACDALVFTSYQEGSPNIVKQAMACNLPIVSTDVGDVREVIGKTDGCLISSADPTVFAARVSDVLRRGERTQGRQDIGHLARPVVAAKILDVYEKTLKKRNQRSETRGQKREVRAGNSVSSTQEAASKKS
jgi:glycosyltransferase involved in cell wall biosynthesis